MNNTFLEHYRRALSLSNEDYNNFAKACHRPLPVTLRIEDPLIKDFILQKYSGNLTKHEFLTPNHVLQLEAEEFKTSSLKQAIISLTEAGLLYRQELVSMLPVYFLGIEPHHSVLDMCAAPGSKTTQILQIIKNGSGSLISNDINPRRCSVLSMHAKRYCFPSHLVTANDARFFPAITFDRILCDVPCSGDGTVRKSPNKLQRWRISDSKGLGNLQFAILKRGLEVLKQNGVLCYSTCSLSPLENEAIVQKALETLDCELVDIPKIPGFKSRPGMVSWDLPEEILTEPWMISKKLNIGLEKCLRVLPHDNDTGGFFVALFRKKQTHAEICLRLSSDSRAGIAIGFDGRVADNFVQAGFHVRDLETNQQTGFSLEAEISHDHNHENDISLNYQNSSDISNNNPQISHNSMTFENSDHQKIYTHRTQKFPKTVGDDAKNSNKAFEDSRKEDIDRIPIKEEKMREPNKKLIRNLVCKDEIYEVDDIIKSRIENCFGVKITDKLITNSRIRNKVSIVSEYIYDILKNGAKSLRVVSAGTQAFNENNLRSDNVSFRASRGVLEKYGFNGSTISLDLEETLAVIEAQNIENYKLKNHELKRGTCVFKLFNINGLFCGQVFENTTALYISKKMRKAIKELLKK